MADRAVTQRNVVTIGDDGLVSLIDGERDKVVGLALESRGNVVVCDDLDSVEL